MDQQKDDGVFIIKQLLCCNAAVRKLQVGVAGKPVAEGDTSLTVSDAS